MVTPPNLQGRKNASVTQDTSLSNAKVLKLKIHYTFYMFPVIPPYILLLPFSL